MAKISALAAIDPGAQIDGDVEVGPFCVIGPEVRIDAGCRLLNDVTLLGRTTVGKDNVFFPNSVIGAAPQDVKHKGAPSELIIGNANVFRELVTVHAGTERSGGITRIGDHGMFMVNAHIGHDSAIGNHVVVANNVVISGNVVCRDRVAIMAGAGVFHFVTLCECSYVGAFSAIRRDVPPFLKVDGQDQIRGVNKIGVRRAGYTDGDVEALEIAYHTLFGRGRPLAIAIEEVEREAAALSPCVERLLEFFKGQSKFRFD